LAAVIVAVGTTAALGAAPASAAAPYCGITWGSGVKTSPYTAWTPITGIRAGRHDCYDRLVIDVRAPGSTYFHVQYVPQVIGDPSGEPIPLRGGAFLDVFVGSTSYDEDGNHVYNPPNPGDLINVASYQTFRQVALGASFEGMTQIGLGVRAQLPFRVFTLANPDGTTKYVIDVAHFW
jgi:hypothetical protein